MYRMCQLYGSWSNKHGGRVNLWSEFVALRICWDMIVVALRLQMFGVPTLMDLWMFFVIIVVLSRTWIFWSQCWWKDTMLSTILWLEKQLQWLNIMHAAGLEQKKQDGEANSANLFMKSLMAERQWNLCWNILWFDLTIVTDWTLIWLDAWLLEDWIYVSGIRVV
jgi:hypothetical protein